ncbi:hypothetical protein DMB92_05580 [Campylobacter sp. MIT 99-7217]|uniref:hypothetical protein n=1 Tax=Campylobacter sp. MIT 99-7217 TaxID=535091 RepID=UPI001158E871|nr:hypothetical protein [Campylobacter sp. MIT 99-7217]TQR31857.1 hypothetical protein DMB92_05580 [Campylobacter sp. MIT 99-7217]
MERIICLLILLACKLFAQDEFIFWAELSSKNYILFHQNENLSMAMTQSDGLSRSYACEIAYTQEDLSYLQRDDFKMIDDDMPKALKFRFLNAHKEELVQCFIGAKINVKDKLNSTFLKAQSETYIQMLPLRFSVEFKENLAIIYELKKLK